MGGAQSHLESDVDADAPAHWQRPDASVLLLGPRLAGKTTVFKQMQLIYGSGYGDAQRREFKQLIHSQLIRSLQSLIRFTETMHQVKADRKAKIETRSAETHETHTHFSIRSLPSKILSSSSVKDSQGVEESLSDASSDVSDCDESDSSSTTASSDCWSFSSTATTMSVSSMFHISDDSEEKKAGDSATASGRRKRKAVTVSREVRAKVWGDSLATVTAVRLLAVPCAEWSEATAELLLQLWKNPQIKAAFFLYRSHCKVPDSTAHFFNDFPRICRDDYLPTDEDILKESHRTPSLETDKFEVGECQVSVYDYGLITDRKERRRVFNRLSTVWFVLSLASFDEFATRHLADGSAKNCGMLEALHSFEQLVNAKRCKRIGVLLLLNKRDVFERKLTTEGKSLASVFPEYKGGAQNVDDSIEFIENTFRGVDRREDGTVFVMSLTATDTENMVKVFGAVKGLMDVKQLTSTSLI